MRAVPDVDLGPVATPGPATCSHTRRAGRLAGTDSEHADARAARPLLPSQRGRPTGRGRRAREQHELEPRGRRSGPGAGRAPRRSARRPADRRVPPRRRAAPAPTRRYRPDPFGPEKRPERSIRLADRCRRRRHPESRSRRTVHQWSTRPTGTVARTRPTPGADPEPRSHPDDCEPRVARAGAQPRLGRGRIRVPIAVPSPTRTITTRDVRRYVDEHVFAPNGAQRVGIELEWITRGTSPDAPPSPSELRSLLDGTLPGASRLTFEPGGQLELSGPAHRGRGVRPSRRWPPTRGVARSALASRRRRAGRDRPRSDGAPRPRDRRAALRSDGDLLRRALADGPDDDAQHRGRAGERRPRRFRHRRPPLAARTRPGAGARGCVRQLALRRVRCTERLALHPPRRVARDRRPAHSACSTPRHRARRPRGRATHSTPRSCSSVPTRTAARCPPARSRSRGGSTTATSSAGRPSTTSPTTSRRCSRPCARAAGSSCAWSTRCPTRGGRWPSRCPWRCSTTRKRPTPRRGRPRPSGTARPTRPGAGCSDPLIGEVVDRCFAAALPALGRIGADERTIRRRRGLLRTVRRAAALPGRRPVPVHRPRTPPDRDVTVATRRMTAATDVESPVEASRRPIAEALTAARTRSLSILDPVPAADQERQVSDLMSPLCWDLAHIGHYEELWLRARARRTRHRPTRASTTCTTRSSTRDASAAPSTSSTPRARGASSPRCATRALDVLAAIPTADLEPGAADPLLAGGFVYGMVVQHEHQHDETMLATLQLMDGFAHPAADGGTGAPTSASSATAAHSSGPTCSSTAARSPWAPTRRSCAEPWAYDNERPGARGHARAVPDRHDARHQPRVRRVRRRRRLRRPAPLDTDAGWAWRSEAGLVAPGSWAPRRRRRLGARALRPHRGRPPRRAGAARVLVRGRRVRALVRRAAPDRGRVGDAPRSAPTRSRPTSGRRAMRRTAGRLRRSALRARRATSVRSGCSATCGSGPPPTSARTPASGASRTASTPRCSSAPSTRCCAAARGRRTPTRCAPRSATGTSRSAARSSPASAARATPDPRCAATSPIWGRPSPLHDLLFGAPHSLARQARHPEHMDAGDDNPDGWGVGWYADGAAAPERYRTTVPDLGRHRVRRALVDDRDRRVPRARPGSRHRARPSTPRATPRSAPGRGSFSLNGIVRGFHDADRPGPPRAGEPRRAAPRSKATPTPRCCSR